MAPKDEDGIEAFDMFALCQGRPEDVNHDALVWDIQLFKSQSGQILACRVEDPDDGSNLTQMLKEANIPDCIFLVAREITEKFKNSLTQAGHNVTVFESNVALSTS